MGEDVRVKRREEVTEVREAGGVRGVPVGGGTRGMVARIKAYAHGQERATQQCGRVLMAGEYECCWRAGVV